MSKEPLPTIGGTCKDGFCTGVLKLAESTGPFSSVI